MPPLVMPWRLRKPSSVCTSTSKIALPIPRTSYFAEVIQESCHGDCVVSENPVKTGLNRVVAAYHDPPSTSKRRCYRSADDSLLPHGIDGNAGLAAIGICARHHDRGAARRGSCRGRLSGGVSARQRGEAAVDGGRVERGTGAGLAARARDGRPDRRGGIRGTRA